MASLGSQPPAELRKGVREGILAALAQDVEQRGVRTAGRLVSAGLAGVAGAIGAMLLVSTHPFGQHPRWVEMVVSTVWAGLLVVSLSLLLLQVRTPGLPIARAAAVGLGSLSLAAICSLLCPDPYVLSWWLATGPGSALVQRSSVSGAALCFGFATTFGFAAIPALLLLDHSASRPPARALAAVFPSLLLAPGLVLESVGLGLGVLAAWLGGAIAGAFAGVSAGVGLRALLRRHRNVSI